MFLPFQEQNWLLFGNEFDLEIFRTPPHLYFQTSKTVFQILFLYLKYLFQSVPSFVRTNLQSCKAISFSGKSFFCMSGTFTLKRNKLLRLFHFLERNKLLRLFHFLKSIKLIFLFVLRLFTIVKVRDFSQSISNFRRHYFFSKSIVCSPRTLANITTHWCTLPRKS